MRAESNIVAVVVAVRSCAVMAPVERVSVKPATRASIYLLSSYQRRSIELCLVETCRRSCKGRGRVDEKKRKTRARMKKINKIEGKKKGKKVANCRNRKSALDFVDRGNLHRNLSHY